MNEINLLPYCHFHLFKTSAGNWLVWKCFHGQQSSSCYDSPLHVSDLLFPPQSILSLISNISVSPVTKALYLSKHSVTL